MREFATQPTYLGDERARNPTGISGTKSIELYGREACHDLVFHCHDLERLVTRSVLFDELHFARLEGQRCKRHCDSR